MTPGDPEGYLRDPGVICGVKLGPGDHTRPIKSKTISSLVSTIWWMTREEIMNGEGAGHGLKGRLTAPSLIILNIIILIYFIFILPRVMAAAEPMDLGGVSLEGEEDTVAVTPEKERELLQEDQRDPPASLPQAPPPPKKKKSGAQRRKEKKMREVARAAGEIGVPPSDGTQRSDPTSFPSPKFKNFYKIPLLRREGEMLTPGPNTPQKRARGTPESETAVAKKRTRTHRETVEGAQSLELVRKDGDKGRLSTAELEGIKAHLRKAIDALEGKTLIKMGGIHLIGGKVVVVCHDETTSLWLQMEVEKLGLLAVPFNRISRKNVGVWVREKHPLNHEEFLKKFSLQNGGINTSTWTIVHQKPVGGGLSLIIRMDEDSHENLKPPTRYYYYWDTLDFSFEAPSGEEKGDKGPNN